MVEPKFEIKASWPFATRILKVYAALVRRKSKAIGAHADHAANQFEEWNNRS